MWTGIVQGCITSTIKHPTMRRGTMLIVQPIHPITGKPEGLAQIAMDTLGAGNGQRVLVSSDGLGCQRILDADRTCPVRLFVGCILHETSIQSSQVRAAADGQDRGG
jgi:ethanolamine utilization protein EutN